MIVSILENKHVVIVPGTLSISYFCASSVSKLLTFQTFDFEKSMSTSQSTTIVMVSFDSKRLILENTSRAFLRLALTILEIL